MVAEMKTQMFDEMPEEEEEEIEGQQKEVTPATNWWYYLGLGVIGVEVFGILGCWSALLLLWWHIVVYGLFW